MSKHDKLYHEVFELLIRAIKTIRPDLTNKEATNAIINVANWKQLQIMQKGKNE